MAASVAPAPTAAGLSQSEREQVYRRNFRYFLGDFVMFSVALQLIGPTTVVPDFVRKLTSSEILIGFSSQMFEVGWLMPQLFIARWLVRVEHKKWWFVGPNIPVRFLVLLFAGIVALTGAEHKALLLAVFLVFYGLAAIGDGLVGVPWMDLIGSSLDNARRARLFGYGQAAVGLLMLMFAPLVGVILGDLGLEFPNNYALLFALSGVLFAITIPVTMLIRELPGGKAQPSMPSMREYLPQLGHVLRTDRAFRAMMLARVTVTLFTMAGPFYIGFATEQLYMSNDIAVSRLLLMQTLGGVMGALLYSRLGDRRTLEFIRVAMIFGVLQAALALLAAGVGPAPLYGSFVAGGIVTGMLGISFLNWVISYANADQRPVYSGLFNTVSAVGLLVAPLTGGTLVELLGYESVFITALLLMVSALAVTLHFDDDLRTTNPVSDPAESTEA